MSEKANAFIQRLLHDSDRSAWSTVALVMGLTGSGSEVQRRAAVDLLGVLDVDVDLLAEDGDVDRAGVAAQAAAPVLQAAALLRGDAELWAGQSDEALVAQGRASAQGASLFARFLFPGLPGLADALSRPGARMLDVGTGVAAMAVAYAEIYPQLTVVGLDVLPRVLGLAASTVAASGVADRVLLREQDVGTLDEDQTYSLAWLPAPFIPEAPLRAGLARVTRALMPGGWVIVGHGKFAGDPVEAALTRFKTVAFGGTAIDDDQAAQLFGDAGLVDVRTVPTPPGAPAITAGRRPPL
jgi:SAM-dependent methyltransferase